MPETTTQTLTVPDLTAADRCDRCGAQAYVRVELANGAALQFCGHHWGTHEAALTPKAARVINQLHKLTESSSVV